MNPSRVRKRIRHIRFVVVRRKRSSWIYLGNMNALLLSDRTGSVFFTPLRICPRKGVSYTDGLQPSVRNKCLQCVTYPKTVDEDEIVGFNTSEAIKKARYSSVLFREPLLNGYRGAVLRRAVRTNEKYAL